MIPYYVLLKNVNTVNNCVTVNKRKYKKANI